MDSRWEKVEPRFFAKRETSLNRNGAEQRRLCPVLSPSAIALPVARTYDLALRESTEYNCRRVYREVRLG